MIGKADGAANSYQGREGESGMLIPLALPFNSMQDSVPGKEPPTLKTVFLPQTSTETLPQTHTEVVPQSLLNPVKLVKESVHYISIELKTPTWMKVGICK